MIEILIALAETLIPADDTPGADAAWTRAFVARHPGRFDALATYLSSLGDFTALTVAEREALLYAHHPTLLGDDPHRIAMRALIEGFLCADGLDASAYTAAPRDRTRASTSDYSTADFIPDALVERHMATWVGTGTYARVWKAGGYAVPPGVIPNAVDDVAVSPERLTLKKQ